MVIVLTPEAWSISGVKRHSMDYHSEVEIHEGDDGALCWTSTPRKTEVRYLSAGLDLKELQLLEKWHTTSFRLCITDVFITAPLFFIMIKYSSIYITFK